MKRTAISLIHLAVFLTTALVAGCAAPPASATADATPSTAMRLGAGDELGMVMVAGDNGPDDQGTRYATAEED